MVADDDIDRALEWLVANATKAAQARANRVYCEEWRKSLKAQIMTEHTDQSLGAQEREAYADERYLMHLQALRTAVEDDERMRWLMVSAQAKIDAWRSFQANSRIQARI